MCTNIADVSTRHLCPGCGIATLCSELQNGMFGLRYCRHCVDKPRERAKHFRAQVRQRLSSVIEEVAQHSLGDVVDSIVASAEELGVDADEWYDTYIGRTRQLSYENADRPEESSIDPVMPIGRTPDGKVGLHCPDVVLTCRCLNFLKHVHLVALLQETGTFMNDAEAIQNGTETIVSKQLQVRGLQNMLMTTCDGLAAIRSLIPHKRDRRLKMESRVRKSTSYCRCSDQVKCRRTHSILSHADTSSVTPAGRHGSRNTYLVSGKSLKRSRKSSE